MTEFFSLMSQPLTSRMIQLDSKNVPQQKAVTIKYDFYSELVNPKTNYQRNNHGTRSS